MDALDFLYQKLDERIDRLESGNGTQSDITEKEFLYELIDELEEMEDNE